MLAYLAYESIGRAGPRTVEKRTLSKSYAMYSSRLHPAGSSRRYSAKNFAIPINFVCYAPEAKHVSLIGDFNDWLPGAHPMKRQPDGAWTIQVALSHGHHRYLFHVDGKTRLDLRAQGVGRNERNEKVSLIAVS